MLKSTFVGLNEISLTELVVDEVTLSGSRCGPFAPALRLLARRLVDVQPLIEFDARRAAAAHRVATSQDERNRRSRADGSVTVKRA